MAHMVPIYAAIAAAEQKKKNEEEETLMAEFMKQDKAGDWEYKIIRGTLSAFRNEGRMRQALEAESVASWELAMKLDDERLVLRRPRTASEYDATLGQDVRPYRTDYGGKTVVLIVALLLLLLGGLVFVFTAFTGAGGLGLTEGYSIIMIGVLGILIVLGLVVVTLKLRR